MACVCVVQGLYISFEHMFILVDGDWGGNGYLAAFLIRFEKHIALFLKHYGHVHGGSLLSSSPRVVPCFTS